MPGFLTGTRLDSLEAVVTNGRLYARDDLDAALARFRERFEGPADARTMMAIVQRMPRPSTMEWPSTKPAP